MKNKLPQSIQDELGDDADLIFEIVWAIFEYEYEYGHTEVFYQEHEYDKDEAWDHFILLDHNKFVDPLEFSRFMYEDGGCLLSKLLDYSKIALKTIRDAESKTQVLVNPSKVSSHNKDGNIWVP